MNKPLITFASMMLALTSSSEAQLQGGGQYLCQLHHHRSQLPAEYQAIAVVVNRIPSQIIDNLTGPTYVTRHIRNWNFPYVGPCYMVVPPEPCPEPPNWHTSYTATSGASWTVGGSATLAFKVQLGSDLVALVGASSEFTGTVSGNTYEEESSSSGADGSYSQCNTYDVDLYETKREASGTRSTSNETVIWLIEIERWYGMEQIYLSTQCNPGQSASGSADAGNSYSQPITITPCCDEPLCCGCYANQ